ncbi:alpha/beta hydrolase [Nocardiopsis halotolerans]|uniref:alpha/beta hydrolase n=1 Tax=Nocardiopsis halotolerans TaxID=124252 RepID=UPI00034598AB|nr:alpha/beta hydrolase [Nocardiopsis halotolerans]
MQKKNRKRGHAKRLLGITALVLALLLVLAVGGFAVWALNPHQAQPRALREALDTPGVEVSTTDEAVVVTSTHTPPDTGIVFYPGGRVAPEAYTAPWAEIAADSAVRVVIPRMPLNLAVFDADRADRAIAEHDGGVDEWYVGGHSLGGAMAASHLGESTDDTVVGLVLWGSYATEGAGLAGREDLAVISVSGSRDGLSDPATIEENRAHLPSDALMYEVSGMNHAQFGAYGEQAGDNPAAISDDEAHHRLADVMSGFLDG